MTVETAEFPELDIELVMRQAHVSRAVAIAALDKCNGDLVNAIIDLTPSD